VRGDIESVLSIHDFLGMPPVEESDNRRIVIVEKNDIRSGILLDSVSDVVDVPVKSIHPPLSILHQHVKDFVIGETSYNDRIVILLDVGKIFEKMML
jgi:purine-binding chemotaxis protein CheW